MIKIENIRSIILYKKKEYTFELSIHINLCKSSNRLKKKKNIIIIKQHWLIVAVTLYMLHVAVTLYIIHVAVTLYIIHVAVTLYIIYAIINAKFVLKI